MPSRSAAPHGAGLLHRNLRRLAVAGHQPPNAARRRLTRWQGRRLARTHRDLLESERFGPAVEFFLGDLYAPRDFRQRDRDLAKVAPLLARVLPGDVLHTLGLALEMDLLTRDLDARLLDRLDARGVADRITQEAWAEAVRTAGDGEDRRRQVALIREVGEDLDRIVARPGIRTALRLAHHPARLAGLGDLQDFLERGYAAFHHMRGAAPLIEAIERRELRLLDRIYAGEQRPLDG